MGPRRLLYLPVLSALLACGALLWLGTLATPAARAAPAAGLFIVNSAADTNTEDGVLTLREAILFANGGPAALGGNPTAGEQAQLGGCVFDGGGNLLSGCGPGIADQIRFSAAYTIVLGSVLPLVGDSGTRIYNNHTLSPTVQINANGVGATLVITGNDTSIEGISLFGSPTGTPNMFIGSPAKRVSIARNTIGATGAMDNCGKSDASTSGIYIESTASLVSSEKIAWVYGNVIRCNRGAGAPGIWLNNTHEVVIGADSSLTPIGNDIVENSNGIEISDSYVNQIVRANVSDNIGYGIRLTGSSSWGNKIDESTIVYQGREGVIIANGASENELGQVLYNLISGNGGDGIVISGTTTYLNRLTRNNVGPDFSLSAALPNGGNGLTISDGAHHNLVGNSDPGNPNSFAGNSGDGIVVTTGAHDNYIAGNHIGASFGTLIPNQRGVVFSSGAYSNSLGVNIAGGFNFIASNLSHGVYISGSNTTTNTVSNNFIGVLGFVPAPNGGDGIRVDGARGNQLGDNSIANASNVIAYNVGNGIALVGGATRNRVSSSHLIYNTLNGVLLDGAGTMSNTINTSYMELNTGDGIAERNSAAVNLFFHIETNDNGGLGIDKFANFGPTDNTVSGPLPVITAVSFNGISATLSGTKSSGTLVEVYAVAPDPSGYGEGRTPLGNMPLIDANTTWTLTVNAGGAKCFTALQLDYFTSSEFGPNSCRTFLPVITR